MSLSPPLFSLLYYIKVEEQVGGERHVKPEKEEWKLITFHERIDAFNNRTDHGGLFIRHWYVWITRVGNVT